MEEFKKNYSSIVVSKMLSPKEKEALTALAVAWDAFVQLPTLHDQHALEFSDHIHAAQRIIMARPVSIELGMTLTVGPGSTTTVIRYIETAVIERIVGNIAVFLEGSDLVGQRRTIIEHSGGQRTITVDPPFPTSPTHGDRLWFK